MSSKNDKWVRRFSVDETAKHKNGFTIYKITSVLFPLASPEAVTVVSVWKRYSDVQRLHKSMKLLHTGLHLPGNFPILVTGGFFKRFHSEIIEERAKCIKSFLEFVAEHRLLFTSTDFVNFLQTGYPDPNPASLINAIRSSLHLPIEDSHPIEYRTDEETSPRHIALTPHTKPKSQDETDFAPRIEIHEAFDVEIRQTPDNCQQLSKTDSFESIPSIDSLNDDMYEELSKITVENPKPSVKRMLPDLIIFDAPSTSKFADYHTLSKENVSSKVDSESVSLNSTFDSSQSIDESRRSKMSNRSRLSLSNVESKTRTEDSYVFEAGYLLNLAARCEDMEDYERAFQYYKSGIEKMLAGVQTDPDPQRRELIKNKTNKYLSYAESIYNNHLCNSSRDMSPPGSRGNALPATLLVGLYEELKFFRAAAILTDSIMLIVDERDNQYYAMKVVQKIPHNLTEFDEYFLQRTQETRQPILPTLVPYMVTLHSYIETNHLIFLVLSYAPGQKLLDYIKNYEKSIPNTPKRQVNLENVFVEPKTKLTDSKIDQCLIDNQSIKQIDESQSIDDVQLSVNDLVIISQKLLVNVDKALNEVPKRKELSSMEDKDDIPFIDDVKENIGGNIQSPVRVKEKVIDAAELLNYNRLPRAKIPPSSICRWMTEIITAIESLHNCGVICRDLNPSNILLGSKGHVNLTYFIGYRDFDVNLSKLQLRPGGNNMYIAPELYSRHFVDDLDERVCDFWSIGAILYELVCGVPLSYHHRSVFTSHTILHLPDGLPLEVQSILTQLLTFDPSERLGSGKDGILEIKQHPYFKQIDWTEVYNNWSVPG